MRVSCPVNNLCNSITKRLTLFPEINKQKTDPPGAQQQAVTVIESNATGLNKLTSGDNYITGCNYK